MNNNTTSYDADKIDTLIADRDARTAEYKRLRTNRLACERRAAKKDELAREERYTRTMQSLLDLEAV